VSLRVRVLRRGLDGRHLRASRRVRSLHTSRTSHASQVTPCRATYAPRHADRCPVVGDARPPGRPRSWSRSRQPPSGRLPTHTRLDVHHLAPRHDPPRSPCSPSSHRSCIPEKSISLPQERGRTTASPAGLCEGAPACHEGTARGTKPWTGLEMPPYVSAHILVSSWIAPIPPAPRQGRRMAPDAAHWAA
jgi:hypothetical protein